MRRFQYSERDQNLPADAHRVALMGRSESLRWPSICANCGNPASERIRIERIFRRGGRYGRRGNRYVIQSADVPFCAACVARHRELVDPPRLFDGWLSVFRSFLIIPLVGSIILTAMICRPLLIESAGNAEARLLGLGVFGFLMLGVAASIVGAWWSNRYFRVQRPTEITQAFDFSDNLVPVSITPRRVFAVRNAAFAEAFSTANSDRLWTDELRQKDARRSSVLAVVLVVVALVIWVFLKVWR
jgi:hypothetical protein